MAADGKKGITVKVDAALHAEITQYMDTAIWNPYSSTQISRRKCSQYSELIPMRN